MAAVLRKRLLIITLTSILAVMAGFTSFNPGNQVYDTVSGRLMKDNRPPDIYISVVAPTGKHGWYNAPVSFLVKSWDSGSGVASEEISIGGGTWYKKSLTIRKDGKYIVYGKSIDRAGNISTTWVKVNIDMTPPEARLIIPEPNGQNGWFVGSVPVALTGSDHLSGVFETNLMIKQDISENAINPWKFLEAPSLINNSDPIFIIEGEDVSIDFTRASMEESGIYYITGYVEDIAGNRTPVDHKAMLDLDPPLGEIRSPGKFFGNVNLEGALLDVNSGVKNLFVDTGDGWRSIPFKTDGKWAAEWETDSLKDGKYLIKARIVDAAGNQTYTYYTATVLNNSWPFFAISGVLISLGIIASFDPRRKAWQEFGMSMAKVAHMEKNAMLLKKELK